MGAGMRKRKTWIILVFSLLLSIITINYLASELSYLNTKIRNYFIYKEFQKFSFAKGGIPEQLSPRLGKYTSPFYVVHFGLLYSESCRNIINDSKYYWLKDETLKFWYGSAPAPSLQRFQTALDWLLANADKNTYGLTHFLYNFDWPYSGYPEDIIKAPWWSGLTDGYAIILLLRGYDCFKNKKYLELAKKLYNSLLIPVSQGGSLTYWDGLPWIEEYVDPRASSDQLSHVFNGMAYAYFGVLAFEQTQSITRNISQELLTSIERHIHEFDKGYWSYYDAKGNPANIKYHGINWALIVDPRISSVVPQELQKHWAVGVRYPILYLIYGPKTIAYFHLLFEVILLTIIYIFIIYGVIRYVS